MKQVTAVGKSVDEAVQQGLTSLGLDDVKQVEVEVIEQPSKGLFGWLGAKPARVILTWYPDPLLTAEAFLQDVMQHLDIEVSIAQQQTDEGVLYSLSGADVGVVIGRRGQTLDALQLLTNIAANKQAKQPTAITLDAESFRARRRKTLHQLADRIAKRVLRTQSEIVLEPMSAAERKMIHTYLQERTGVRTYSKGNEPHRRVVIAATSSADEH